MNERVALITGGVKGIGRAIALALAERGWSVAVCYRSSHRHAEELQAALLARGVRALALPSDVSRPEAAEALVRQVEQEWERIDALINCAGPYRRINVLDESPGGWREMFDNNLHPVFYLGRAVAPGMKARRWGRIVTFSVVNADQMIAQPELTAYYVAKVGVLVLTRSLARVLAPHGITVNAISPGFIRTESFDAEAFAPMVQHIPAGYLGEARDAVSAACFLLSDEARYITGTNVHVSGGWGI
jgi:3-oxoacyl-[acyl-carrier protein] reductase